MSQPVKSQQFAPIPGQADAIEYLKSGYGREVPLRVKLGDGFDPPPGSRERPGDIVHVCLPPANVELDDVSLWVFLSDGESETPQRERLYDHEFTAV